MARPSKFTEKLADEICERLVEGESLREICKDDHIPNASTICRWLDDERYSSFCKQYTRAREFQADTLFDEALDIADNGSNDWMERNEKDNPGWAANGEHIQRSKLRIDTRKWMAGKLRPKRYGEKIVQEVTGEDGGPVKVEDVSARDMLLGRIGGIASRKTEAESD